MVKRCVPDVSKARFAIREGLDIDCRGIAFPVVFDHAGIVGQHGEKVGTGENPGIFQNIRAIPIRCVDYEVGFFVQVRDMVGCGYREVKRSVPIIVERSGAEFDFDVLPFAIDLYAMVGQSHCFAVGRFGFRSDCESDSDFKIFSVCAVVLLVGVSCHGVYPFLLCVLSIHPTGLTVNPFWKILFRPKRSK